MVSWPHVPVGNASPSLYPQESGLKQQHREHAQEAFSARAMYYVAPASSTGSEGMGKLLGTSGLLWSCIPLAEGGAVLPLLND